MTPTATLLTASVRDVIVAAGPDTATFLHAMLSQDITAMVDGDVRWAFLLTPQGKVVSHFRVHRMRAHEFFLDVDAGQGESLRASLSRYLIRTKCALTIREDMSVVTGPADEIAALPVSGLRVLPAHPLYSANAGAPLVEVFDLPESVVATVPVVSEIAHDETRIRSGYPLVGVDLDDTSVPNGTGLLPWAVSFGKGCYVGQELVERIDSRAANVPTRLAHLSAASERPRADATERSPVRVTSGVTLPDGTWIGLGWVSRSLEEGADSSGITVGHNVGVKAEV